MLFQGATLGVIKKCIHEIQPLQFAYALSAAATAGPSHRQKPVLTRPELGTGSQLGLLGSPPDPVGCFLMRGGVRPFKPR